MLDLAALRSQVVAIAKKPKITDALGAFGPATREWFGNAFAAPTPVQSDGWRSIASGAHSLLLAPTGSGKTLAAFLWCIDRLTRLPHASKPGVRALYISPLKALAYDVERNLRAPLVGIERAAASAGEKLRPVRVSVRTGDTPPRERRLLLREPGDILITTPESLYLLLGSQARQMLRTVDTVIIDEIHALAPTKRGAHLALSLERLTELTGREPQRIGLSATQRPLDEIARYLGGVGRTVEIIDASEKPRLDLTIEVPVEGASAEEQRGIWPAIHPRLVELIRSHRSTIIFTNSRRLCERLAQRLNELAGDPPLVRAHHGSLARAQREEIEELLKSGQLRGIVATSSLELGIDMGAVDLVIQIESPGAVSRGLQRVGRAGHSVGERSIGRIFPKYRGDLLEAAVVARRMLDGEVESVRVPRNPLDVLAQQIVAMCSVEDYTLDRLERVVRRAYSFSQLSRDLFIAVLDMLSGRYPSDAFADLRPRIIWDRTRDQLTARRDARLLALVNGGTIPDRGMYGVHLGAEGPRVGELDEEMVHETRAGETFLLGATTWRVLEITRDRVIVAPAPGEPGKMPFWRGEGPGRPIDLGRALGAFVRAVGERGPEAARNWLMDEYKLDALAASSLWRYIDDQRQATGTLPTDRSITVERFRDELGDWRICILSPFGARVHAPWALALESKLSASSGFEVQTLWSDDGIVLRFADTDEVPTSQLLIPDPEELEELLLGQLGRSAMFATHFRENAARALLLPRRRVGARTPLWSQRIRAQNLLAVASRHPGFPIVLETYRECLHDVFDVPALIELLGAIQRREVRVVDVETSAASPFARTLAFAYVAAYIYEGDAPLAERRAQALTLDRNLLRELLGQEELRDLLEPEVLDEVEAELQSLVEDRRVRSADSTHDLLRRIGNLTGEEIGARAQESAGADLRAWLTELQRSGRATPMRIAGQARWVAVEDVARYRDALGVPVPQGISAVHLDATTASLEGLIARWARTHGPFVSAAVAARFGLVPAQVEPVLRALRQEGRLVEGELRPGTTGTQWCDVDVLRILRRRTLARLRHQVAPVEAAVLARFLPRWHGIGAGHGGLSRMREVVEQLEGVPLAFSELEKTILPARVSDYQSRMLDELGALGEIVWVGRGALGSDDGRIALYRRGRVAALLDAPPALDAAAPPLQRAILEQLESRGASFFTQLEAAAGSGVRESELLSALWDLVWAGLVTNDTFQPLRALGQPRRVVSRGARRTVGLEAGGRWSAVAQLIALPPSDTEKAHARALMMLERYGVVSREAALAEGLAGGFASVSGVLRAMEESGKIRRGYFVEGLGGAQFAHPGAVNRLRAARIGPEDGAPDVVTLSAVDPAQVYGTLLPWPAATATADAGDDESSPHARPRRAAGAKLVLVRGIPVFYLESGGKKLRYFTAGVDEDMVEPAFVALRQVAARRRHRQLRVEKINGVAALQSEHASLLERNGFRAEPGGLTLSVTES